MAPHHTPTSDGDELSDPPTPGQDYVESDEEDIPEEAEHQQMPESPARQQSPVRSPIRREDVHALKDAVTMYGSGIIKELKGLGSMVNDFLKPSRKHARSETSSPEPQETHRSTKRRRGRSSSPVPARTRHAVATARKSKGANKPASKPKKPKQIPATNQGARPRVRSISTHRAKKRVAHIPKRTSKRPRSRSPSPSPDLQQTRQDNKRRHLASPTRAIGTREQEFLADNAFVKGARKAKRKAQEQMSKLQYAQFPKGWLRNQAADDEQSSPNSNRSPLLGRSPMEDNHTKAADQSANPTRSGQDGRAANEVSSDDSSSISTSSTELEAETNGGLTDAPNAPPATSAADSQNELQDEDLLSIRLFASPPASQDDQQESGSDDDAGGVRLDQTDDTTPLVPNSEPVYMAPDFNPNSLTAGELRRILRIHGVEFYAHAVKPMLMGLFMRHVNPRALTASNTRARWY